ncbi:hypothetical protein [Siminovitchia fortis]
MKQVGLTQLEKHAHHCVADAIKSEKAMIPLKK